MKKTILTLLAIVSMQYFTIAQNTNVFEGIPIALNQEKQNQLDSELNDFIVFEFPFREFNDYLKRDAKDNVAYFNFKIGTEVDWEIALTENDIRSQNLLRTRISSTGIKDVDTFQEVNTYKGMVGANSNNWIRWFVSDRMFIGTVTLQNEHYKIEPLSNYLKAADQNEFVLVKKVGDISINENGGNLGILEVKGIKPTTDSGTNRVVEPTRWLEFAAEVDYAFYEDYDNDEQAVEETICARVNELDGLYQNIANMAVVLVHINIYKSPNDPYHNITDILALFNKVQDTYNSNFKCVHRDVVHLFTGMTGFGADGVANGNGVFADGWSSICGTWNEITAQYHPWDLRYFAYSVSTNARGFDSWLTTAHELGHNFSLTEECLSEGDYIMCGGSCLCGDLIPNYSSQDITAINNYLGGINTAYPWPQDGPGDFNKDVCLVEHDPQVIVDNQLISEELDHLAGLDLPYGSTLPSSEGNTYNFGVLENMTIPEVTVENGGFLRVNNVGPTSYGAGPNTQQNEFTAYNTRCGSKIIIDDGGSFILGNDDGNVPGNHKANVHIRELGQVIVKTGGNLRLARGSQLIIEEGASLVIDVGADIDLWWSDSRIVVKGELIVHGDFDFGGSGFFQFEPTARLKLLSSSFKLHGQGDRFMRLSAGTILDIGESMLDLKSGEVEYEPGSYIRIGEGGSAKAEGVDFNSYGASNGNFAIYAEGADDIDISFCDFNNLAYGVNAQNLDDNGLVRIIFSNFNNCIFGVVAFNYPEIEISYSNFNAGTNGLHAIFAEQLDELSMIACTVNDYSNFDPIAMLATLDLRGSNQVILNGTHLTDNTIGVSLANVTNFNMWGGSIKQDIPPGDIAPNGTIGIFAPTSFAQNYSNINLYSGATIQSNAIGIWVQKGGDGDNNTTYGNVLMDCAKLVYNDVGIQGVDISLSIDALEHCSCNDLSLVNPNTFLNNLGTPTPQRLFDICYDDLETQTPFINARANYWGGGTPVANNDYHFRVISDSDPCEGFSDIPLITGVVASFPPTNCNNGQDPSGDNKSEIDNKVHTNNSFLIYPNPASNEIVVQWEKSIENGNIRIVSIDGKLVFETVVLDINRTKIQTDKLPRGLYLVQIISDSFNDTKKLILE